MPYANPTDPANIEKMRAARRKHYRENKQPYLDRSKVQKEAILNYIRTVKDVPCMDCGKRYPPYVMDLDHRDPLTKLREPAKLHTYGSMAKAIEEVAKCDVVCSNCHRERTHSRT